jgi:Pentapeptide repeats (8 copies)
VIGGCEVLLTRSDGTRQQAVSRGGKLFDVWRAGTIAAELLAVGLLAAGCSGSSPPVGDTAASARPSTTTTTTPSMPTTTLIGIPSTTAPFSGCPTLDSSDLSVSPHPSPGVNWAGCNLQSANLRNSDFRGANLQRVNLGYSELQGADLAGVDLSQATLDAADLTGADLVGARMVITGMEYTNLTGANLTGVRFDGFPPRDAIWSDTTCPDGTNSNAHRGSCLDHLS